MAEIVQITKDGVVQYPITKPEAVIDENGKTVKDLIAEASESNSYDDTAIKERISDVESSLEEKQDAISDLDVIRDGASKGATALQSVPSEYMTEEEVGASFVKKGTFIMPNNGFDDSSMNTFGFSFLSNALYAADKRFDVQLSGFSSDTAANLFNGSYEDSVDIAAGTTGVITIANNGASIIDGYPYGEIYVSFYYENTPQDVTVRAYCNFEAHGIGWKTLPLSQIRGEQNGVYVFPQGYYNITELEITVTAKSDTPTHIVQLDWNLSRAALRNYAAVTKFGLEQELFGKYKFADAIALGGRTISSWDDLGYATTEAVNELRDDVEANKIGLLGKQDTLVSGTNIKTINGESILGSGDLTIEQGETLTEQDIAAMGFTKNTGTYSKPTTGIPKTDLASDVQASLGKADTALQSYTEQYTGTITEVKVNNTSIATEGVANIPEATTGRYGVTRLASEVTSTSIYTAATSSAVKAAYDLAKSKQDALVSGTNIKTINGASILGEGNLTVESNNGSAVVVHTASETEVELTPNVIHKWDGATSLSLTVPEDPDGMVYSYKAVFVVASSVFSLSLPYNLRWVNSTMPVFEYGMQYEISIEGGRVLWAKFDEPAIEGEELPWIENDGTDYILTDYYPDENDVKQSVKFSVLETLTHHQCIVGTSEGSTLSTTKIAIWALSNNGNILQYFDATNTKLGSSTTVGQVYEFSGESTAATKLNASRPLVVFNLNSSSGVTSTNAAHARFYYFRLYDASGKVTLDLRPFKRTSDGAIGVLDAVSGTFYPSVNGNLTEGA